MSDRIDLNADLGEGFGVYRCGADEELIPLVSSVNIACGFHGGDPAVMRRAVSLAVKSGAAIGAHPGYPDREGFGRRYMALSPDEVTDCLLVQIGALEGVCRAEGAAIGYVKPHGALYNAAAKDPALAAAVVRALKLYGGGLVLLCPAGSEMENAAKAEGIKAAGEFFSDRAYRDDGSLVPRSEPNAVITDPEEVGRRVLEAVGDGVVVTASGKRLRIGFDSICLHGDDPEAVRAAAGIRRVLETNGIEIRSFA